jgi:hypothetical protein
MIKLVSGMKPGKISLKMYGQVKNIDDEQGVVYLDCKYEKDTDETFVRIYPLKHFKK